MARFTTNIKINIAAVNRAIKRQAHPIIQDAIFDLRGILAEEFAGPKSGRVYRRPSGSSYRASAPGEPPAIRSGFLLRSIRETFPALNVGRLHIGAPYAGLLERGTPRVAARPFVEPAVRELARRWNGGL